MGLRDYKNDLPWGPWLQEGPNPESTNSFPCTLTTECCCGQYNSAEYNTHIKPLFYLEPCIYGHKVLSHAACVFAAVRNMPPPPSLQPAPPPTPPPPDDADIHSEPASSRSRRRHSGVQSPQSQPTIDFRSRAEKRLSFNLVFQTLKCEIRLYHFPAAD